jgi:hypothetical protein
MSDDIYKPGELILAFPLARPPQMKQVGLLLSMTIRRDDDSGGNEWSVLCSDGQIWSLAEFQFKKFIP